MEKCKVLMTFLMAILVSRADETEPPPTPARICVLQNLMASCDQMEQELSTSYKCVAGRDMLDCARKIQRGEADITSMDPHGLYVGGKYFGLVPLTQELFDGAPYRYQGIAIVQKASNISSLSDLQGRRSCHTGTFRTAGWKIPLAVLRSRKIMPADCRGELYTAESFFSGSCAPGKWSNDPLIDKELKQRHKNLCSQCQDPRTCSSDDAYSGYKGAIQCLLDDAGDVAFTKISALKEYLEENPSAKDSMELLCLDGTRMPVTSENLCSWAHRPTSTFVTSGDQPDEEHERLVEILLDTQRHFPPPHVRTPDWYYKTFLSSSSASGLQTAPEGQRTYDTYLGDFLYSIERPSDDCEEKPIRFCVISEEEKQKCEDFSRAATGRSFQCSIQCVLTSSKAACMEAIKEGNADIITLDGGDVYRGGRYYGMQPVTGEVYDGSDASYFPVAVMRSASDVEKFSELRGLRSCHTGIGRTAGWVIPIEVLIHHGLIPSDECNRAESIANFFGSSCAPGANDTKYNPGRHRADDLCKRCIGDEDGENKCSRDSRERYSGYAGALRCLAEGAGDVSFVKHTTVPQYTDGKGDVPWAKDLLSSDFQLLCRDGGRSQISDYRNCSLAKVPSHYVMTSGTKDSDFRLTVAACLSESAKHFADNSALFKLFETYEGHPDLLFKDSTTTLKAPPLSDSYTDVLGEEFFEASKIADPKLCQQR